MTEDRNVIDGATDQAAGPAKQTTIRVELTVFEKDRGALSKRIFLGLDGKLKSDGSECKMSSGFAHRVRIDGPGGLAKLINGMRPKEALTLGRLLPKSPDDVRVMTKEELEKTTPLPDDIARTGEYLEYVKQPACLLLDHDSKGMPPDVAAKVKQAGGVWPAITAVAPGLKGAALVIRRSTSAGLYNEKTGVKFPGSANSHRYLFVADGTDIPRALAVLFDKLWLAGLGFMIVNKAGQLLERSIIDASVGGPERLVFEGGPILRSPVAQDKRLRIAMAVDGKVIDTREALPDLTEAELKQLKKLKSEEKARLKPQADEARGKWAERFAKKHGISKEAALKIIKAATEKQILAPEFELLFDDAELGCCTVAAVLADPDKYVGRTLSDPLDPDDGTGKAKLFRRDDGRLTIHSFAHGGANYLLGNNPPSCSEAALALDFAERHADELRFVAPWGKWMVWDGVRWHSDATLLSQHLATEICVEAAAKFREPGLASSRVVQAVERLAKADRRLAATTSQWDQDGWKLGTPGGVVFLREGKLYVHDRDDFITKLTGVTPDWDMPTPNWFDFLDLVTKRDRDLEDYLQRMSGYSLTGDTSEHALFFLYGTGNNGKTTFINAIREASGEYHRTAPMNALMVAKGERHPTELAGLRGRRLVTAIETDKGRHWDEAKIKQLTGGDEISARLMRQDFFDFTPEFKLMIAGNNQPGLRSVDVAIKRRLHLIPFTINIAKVDKTFYSRKLVPELPGVLAWMIDGCVEWQQHGLAPPQAVTKATGEYFEAEDTLGQWIEECCECGPNFWGGSEVLFVSWAEWARKREQFVGTETALVKELQKQGMRRGKHDEKRGLYGLRLK
jgi:putative DNA primase/helicase